MEERLFTERDLRELERDYADGMSSRQILDLFNARGIRFSEATFRKYIQLGLLPRSKRIGRKGKHRGSQGIYPPGTVRRIVAIKRMMAESYTIEDIQRSFLQFKITLDSVESELNDLFTDIEQKLQDRTLEASRRRLLVKELVVAKRVAADLVKRLASLEQQVVEPSKGEAAAEVTWAATPLARPSRRVSGTGRATGREAKKSAGKRA